MLRTLRAAALATGLLVCVVAGTAPASAAPVRPASGAFTVAVDFPSATFIPVGPRACRVGIDATLTFSGTVAGTASGRLGALVLAPCAQAQTTPPGTAADVFRFDGAFTGTVAGAPATGRLTYAGVTRVGGAIDATVVLRGTAHAALRAEAVAGVGGTYVGLARR